MGRGWKKGGCGDTLSHGQPSMHPLNSFKIRGFEALRLAGSDLSLRERN